MLIPKLSTAAHPSCSDSGKEIHQLLLHLATTQIHLLIPCSYAPIPHQRTTHRADAHRVAETGRIVSKQLEKYDSHKARGHTKQSGPKSPGVLWFLAKIEVRIRLRLLVRSVKFQPTQGTEK